MPFCSYSGDAKNPSYFLLVQTRKEAKPNDLGLLGIFFSQLCQGLIQCEEVVRGNLALDFHVVQR